MDHHPPADPTTGTTRPAHAVSSVDTDTRISDHASAGNHSTKAVSLDLDREGVLVDRWAHRQHAGALAETMAETMIVTLEYVRDESDDIGWRWRCGKCGLSLPHWAVFIWKGQR